MADPTEELLKAMASVGLHPKQIIWDSRFHRFPGFDQNNRGDNGYYKAFVSQRNAFFGDNRTKEQWNWPGSNQEWRDRIGNLEPLSAEEVERRKEEAAKARAEALAEAQVEVDKLWDGAAPCDNHPYLERKSIRDVPFLRSVPDKDNPADSILLIPMRDHEGKLKSIQRIWPDGTRKQMWNADATGTFNTIGGSAFKGTNRIYLCEGWATGWSIHLATQGTVAVAFFDHGLVTVATILRKKYPEAKLVVCADNDRWTEAYQKAEGKKLPNPGVYAARLAAKNIGAELCIPDFANLSDVGPGEKGPTDYDDLRQREGLKAVLRWLDPKQAKHADTTPPEPDPPQEAPEPTPTPSATKPAPKAKRGKTVHFYDNELADLLDDADRLRWIYDPRRGWYFAPEDGWEWGQDHMACQLRTLLRDRAEQFAAEAGRILKLRNTTTKGAVAMTQALVIDQPQWDSNPMIAGLPGGGVLDLATGDCRPTTRDEFVSRCLGVRPDPDAPPPNRFLDFLNDMTRDDWTTEWLIAWLAYALTGHRHVSDHSVPMLVGDGGSGKTTLTMIAAALLGTYRVKLPADVLVARANAREAHPEWLTRLDGSRLAIATEIPERGRIRAAVFKELTGDGDIRAHRMRQNSYEFTPTAKIMMYGNAPPTLPGWDTGLKRRMVVVRCHSKPKAQRVEALSRIIVDEEAPAILNHLANVAAVCFDRHNEGKAWLPDPSAASETETTDLFDESNPLGQAIKTLFTITGNPDDRILASQLRSRIQRLYNVEGWKNVPGPKTVAAELYSHARQKAKETGREVRVFSEAKNSKRYWLGIAGNAS